MTGQYVRLHSLRYAAIIDALRKTKAIGMDLPKVWKFSRKKLHNTLQIITDAVQSAQVKIAELVTKLRFSF
jgi:hypothetical protein